MKLKYYMRGLGIGIILTTLILTLGNGKISDDEVIKRATALGMTFEEDEDDKLKEMLGNGEAISPSLAPPTGNPTTAPTPTVEPTSEPSPTVTLAPTQAPKPTGEPDKEQVKAKKISFTIKKGMGSKEISRLLEEVGLVPEAEEFNKYIVKKGMASKIIATTYKIKENSSYDEIIAIITAK